MNDVLTLPLWIYLLLWISISGLLLWYGFRAASEQERVDLEEACESYQTMVLLLEELHQQIVDLTARMNALHVNDPDPDWVNGVEGLDEL